MFAEDVGRVLGAINVVETNDSASDGFLNSMEGECFVLLGKLGMWDGRTVNYGLVVTKHVSLLADRNSQIADGVLEIDGLINADSCNNELRSIGSSLHSCLFLGVPIDGSLVGQVQDTSNRPPGD